MIEQDLYTSQSDADSEEVSSSGDNGKMFGVTVIDALTQLFSHKRLILIVTGASMLIGLVYGLVAPVEYTSAAIIMPPKQTSSTTSFLNSPIGMGALADAAGGGLSLRDPNAIYLGLLRSRPIADVLIDKFGLAKVYHSRDMTAARKKLERNTVIKSEASSLISISVTDGDKKRAADIANAYTEQLRLLSKSISFTEASRRRLFFEEQLKGEKEVLIAAEVAFQQVQVNKGLVHLDSQANVIIGSLSELHGQIAAKEVELQALRSFSTEQNPDVQLVESELSTMREEADQMEQHSQPTGYSDMGLKDIPKAGLDYIRAARELQYQQAFFDVLLRQYEAAGLDETKEASTIQVVAPAIEADRESSPHRLLILLLFTIGGFLASCFFARWRYVSQSDPDLARALQNLKCTLTAQKAVVS
ncbi:MAG: GumC family protein [Terracidiphilus sp.]